MRLKIYTLYQNMRKNPDFVGQVALPRHNNHKEWQKYKAEKAKGHVLLPDNRPIYLQANDYDAEKIGQHFLEILPKIIECKEGLYL